MTSIKFLDIFHNFYPKNLPFFFNFPPKFIHQKRICPKKYSEYSAKNLQSFEDSSAIRNGPKTKMKMGLQPKIFKEQRSSKIWTKCPYYNK